MPTWLTWLLVLVLFVVFGYVIDAAVNPVIKEIRDNGQRIENELRDIKELLEKLARERF